MEVQWSLVLFAALSAWGAGTYAATAVFGEVLGWGSGARKPCLVLSAVALIVGAVASMTHLGHLDRIFGVLSNPSSGIFVEGLSAGLLVLVVAVYLIAIARNASDGVLKGIAVVGLIPAVVLTVAVGSSYLMASKPAWNVLALPLLSMGTAVVMGCVTYLAFAVRNATVEQRARLAKVAVAAVAIQLVCVVAYLVMVWGAPYQDPSRSVERVVMGDMAPLFWIGVVVLGLATPLAASIYELRTSRSCKNAAGETAAVGSSMGALFVATACVLMAAIAFRVIMFSIGSSIISFGF